MTTPTPPPGMEILTDYTKPLPSGAMIQMSDGWAASDVILGSRPHPAFNYAIPITHPATGDKEPPPGYRKPTEDEIENGFIPAGALKQHLDGTWHESKIAGLKFDNIFVYAVPTTGDAKPVEQRQELPIPEAYYSCGGSCREDRSLPADDLAWFPKVKLWLCCECSEDKEEVGDAEITLEDYLNTSK